MDTPNTFTKKIKEFVKSKKLTQIQLIKMFDISRPSLNRILNGRCISHKICQESMIEELLEIK